MNIVILDDYQDFVRKLNCFELLAPHSVKVYTNSVKGVAQLTTRLSQADVLVLFGERTGISRSLLEKLPNLKLISQAGPVGEHIDLLACCERGVAVAEGVASGAEAVAELAWALIMAAARRLPQYIGNLKHGAWQQSGFKSACMPPNFGLGFVLKGKYLGVLGFGDVGRLVAGYGRAFGMRVVVFGSDSCCAAAAADGFEVASSRAALFSDSDVLSVHLPLCDENRACIRFDDLRHMKPTALFVNTSRAELLEHEALVSALNLGRPGMAAVDVFDSEPILQGHALLRMENCICTPHIGLVERECYEGFFGAAFANVCGFLNGDFSSLVNPDVCK